MPLLPAPLVRAILLRIDWQRLLIVSFWRWRCAEEGVKPPAADLNDPAMAAIADYFGDAAPKVSQPTQPTGMPAAIQPPSSEYCPPFVILTSSRVPGSVAVLRFRGGSLAGRASPAAPAAVAARRP
jgi:hypothetical protein